MNEIKILLVINSLLLAGIGGTFLVVGYFLRDLHKDFKELIQRVNRLYEKFEKHIIQFDNTKGHIQDQINRLRNQVDIVSTQMHSLAKDQKKK